MSYFDHAATSLPRAPVALEGALRGAELGNPGRGLHRLQRAAADEVDRARRAVGALLPAMTVTFHAGATAALNQAIAGLRPRPRVVALGPMLHNAARRPARALGVPTWTLPHDADGVIDLDRARAEWVDDTGLVVVGHSSNVTGVGQPVEALCALAKALGARVVLDAAPTAGVWSLDLGADLVAFSAHKHLRALPGTGVLGVGPGVELEPLVRGGVGFDAAADEMPEVLPERLEAGTPNLPGILALGAAARVGVSWDVEAASGALEEVVHAAGLRVLGRSADAPALPVVSFTVAGQEPRAVEEMLDRVFDVTVRAGLHCAPSAHRVLGTERTGTVRVSSGSTTTAGDLAELARALSDLARHARAAS